MKMLYYISIGIFEMSGICYISNGTKYPAAYYNATFPIRDNETHAQIKTGDLVRYSHDTLRLMR